MKVGDLVKPLSHILYANRMGIVIETADIVDAVKVRFLEGERKIVIFSSNQLEVISASR